MPVKSYVATSKVSTYCIAFGHGPRARGRELAYIKSLIIETIAKTGNFNIKT